MSRVMSKTRIKNKGRRYDIGMGQGYDQAVVGKEEDDHCAGRRRGEVGDIGNGVLKSTKSIDPRINV